MKKIIYLFLISLLFASCRQHKVYQEETGKIFNTVYQVKYQSNTLLTQKIDAELQAFNMSLNPFNPNSILAKINRNEEVEVDQWFTAVFNKAMEVSARSNGMFDVTAAPLINVWGFGFEQTEIVTQEVIDSLKAFVGYRKVRLEGKYIIKDDPRLMLNFSAIAKGYACDVIAALLEREGVQNYMVNIGGEIAAQGKNAKGICWQIGINEPEDEVTYLKSEYKAIVRLCDKSGLATSGNYRNFHIIDGKKYGHTIDPVTGYPAEQSILSATIVAPDCMTADAYATAFMAMGVEAACRMAEQVPEIAYYLIYSDEEGSMQITYSKGMSSKLVLR
jgi:thiamine biosynthesis lipoprotein